MIRTFIAIALPDAIREHIARDIHRLRLQAPRIKWSHPDNLHITLRFLGDVKENDLDELFDALDANLRDNEPFPLEITGIGAFPNWRHPRVVWAGCGEGAEDSVALAGIVEDICIDLGYERERRPFRPHITLGRVKLPADAEELEDAALRIGDAQYGFVDVDEVVVYMSSLRRTGPVYSPMARFPLG